ncbi:hypothetical protein [Actinoplanes sp. HUAS TT8]|uniref:hypothetical protein n=1 Tax=Actinoplanes sp. HUAS TT8 TaxID=3447453 RepID=UPI003F51CEF5
MTTVLSAHTYAEAYLYLDLTACECGETRFAPATHAEDGTQRWYGPCPNCGRDRDFRFRFADYADRTTPGYVEYSHHPGPSELIDAAQWLWVCEQYASSVPATIDELRAVPADQRAAVQLRLSAAGSALDEVFKFLPRGTEDMPGPALWSDWSRQSRAAAPDRFRRPWLERRADELRRLLSALPGVPAAEFFGGDPGYQAKLQRLSDVRSRWIARHGLAGLDDTRVTPEQRHELERAERAASDLDMATGFSLNLPGAAVAAYNRLPWAVQRQFKDDPAERDRRLAALTAVRADWLARTGHPAWDPDSIEDEFEIPADRLPPAAETWEMVRSARRAAGMDPDTGDFVEWPA